MGIYDIQVGDRVQCVKKYGRVPKGAVGTICDIEDCDPPIGVYWDDDIGGHDCGDKCPYGYGFYVPLRHIILIAEEDEAELDLDPGMGLI